MAAALIIDFGALDANHRNYALLMLTDPAMRTLHTDWQREARACVSMLRIEAGQHPGDQRLAALVGQLGLRDQDFRRWWADHHVAARQGGTKRRHHPVAGDLKLQWDALTSTDPDQQLVIWDHRRIPAAPFRFQAVAAAVTVSAVYASMSHQSDRSR